MRLTGGAHGAGHETHERGSTIFGPSHQYSKRDQPEHTVLKERQEGQAAPEEIARKDLKRELEERERAAREGKGASESADKEQASALPKADEPKFLMPNPADADEGDDDDEGQQDEEAEEEEEEDMDELMAELERVKQEREAEKERKEREEKERERQSALEGNVLMDFSERERGSFQVKRRWDEDVPFKNTARDEPQPKKRFINDTIRSDFHRRFLNKYIR